MDNELSDDEKMILEAHFHKRMKQRIEGYRGMPLTPAVVNSIKEECLEELEKMKKDIWDGKL